MSHTRPHHGDFCRPLSGSIRSTRSRRFTSVAAVSVSSLAVSLFAGIAHAQTLDLASVATGGAQANGGLNIASTISADGRYVAFMSDATNLVPGDTNARWDIFVRDRETGETSRVSVSSSGEQASWFCFNPSISGDGRFVTIETESVNLVANDTNAVADIFVHDRQTAETTRVSVSSAGVQANAIAQFSDISLDGRFVVFQSAASNLVVNDTNGGNDIFVHDRQTAETTRVSVSSVGAQLSGNSQFPSISADGMFVAFQSDAADVVPGDTNGTWDIFVHDRNTGETTRASVSTGGAQGNGLSFRPSIAENGVAVCFFSDATNLIAGGDTNGASDVYVHDRTTGETTRVSVSSSGEQALGGNSHISSISADGRFVAFPSVAFNLVPDDTNGFEDVFLHDRMTGETIRLSESKANGQANGISSIPAISADGTAVSFHSEANNLVAGDTNGLRDVFVADIGSAGNPADLDGNGVVNLFDLLDLLAAWGVCPDPGDCPADLETNGAVDLFDLLFLLANWG